MRSGSSSILGLTHDPLGWLASFTLLAGPSLGMPLLLVAWWRQYWRKEGA